MCRPIVNIHKLEIDLSERERRSGSLKRAGPEGTAVMGKKSLFLMVMILLRKILICKLPDIRRVRDLPSGL